MRILIIDDVRSASIAERHMTFNHRGHATEDHMVMICRTHDDGLAELKDGGPWNVLMLDHDLGCYNENGREQNGYHILCFLEENPQFTPDCIDIITANASVRRKMEQVAAKLVAAKQNSKK